MANLHKLINGGFHVGGTGTIKDVAAEAISIADMGSCPVAFTFNGVIVTVTSSSNPDLIEKAYLRATHSGRTHIGPHPREGKNEALNLDDLKREVSTVNRLLQDWRPGLISWNMGLYGKLKRLRDIIAQAFDLD